MVAGLRPGTPDNAPIVGRGRARRPVLATGHFRNGILLAPLTAEGVVALLQGEALPPELGGGRPGRFAGADPEVCGRDVRSS